MRRKVVARLKTSATVGRLLRREYVRLLKSKAHELDVELTLEEDKGWLDSEFYITAEGNENDILSFRDFVKSIRVEET